MKPTLDKQVSIRVKSLMDKYSVKGTTIANYLGMRPSSVSDMLLGKSPWRITQLVELAIYFGLTLEELVFDDKDYTKKESLKRKSATKDNLIKLAEQQGNSLEFIELIKKSIK